MHACAGFKPGRKLGALSLAHARSLHYGLPIAIGIASLAQSATTIVGWYLAPWDACRCLASAADRLARAPQLRYLALVCLLVEKLSPKVVLS